MANLPVPARHRPGLIELTKLPTPEVKAVVASLDDAPVSIEGIADVLKRFLPDGADPDDAAVALVSLSLVLASGRIEAAELGESVRETLGPEYGGADVTELIVHEKVVTVAKAVELQSAYDRLLTNSRIVTDIRPVFPQTVTGGMSDITAAVIANVLHLSFYENGRRHEMSFALRRSELQQLRDHFDRALEKNTAVRDFIKKSGLSVFDEGGNNSANGA